MGFLIYVDFIVFGIFEKIFKGIDSWNVGVMKNSFRHFFEYFIQILFLKLFFIDVKIVIRI